MAGEQRPLLLERGAELAFLGDALTGVRDSRTGRVIAIEGAAGVGKTALVAELIRRARASGFLVLLCRGGELERDLSWGVIRDLLAGRLRELDDADRRRVLSGAARHAGPIFGLAEVAIPSGEGADRIASVLNGLYWTVAGLADAAPLLVCIDDAHWSDVPSLRFLAYFARRADELPVLLTVTHRPLPLDGGAPADDPAAALLANVISEGEVRRLSPLSAPATGELVRRVLGERAQDEFCRACHAVTGGNPFMLRELTGSFAAEGIDPVAANAELVAEIRPDRVVASVLRRLAQLPEAAICLARATAILSLRAPLRAAGELAELDEPRLVTAFEDLLAADILTNELAPTFVHPLVREVIYHEMSAATRARLHAAAARQLRERDAPLSEIATQLMATPPREVDEAASILLRAAEQALARGAADAAVRYARRALDETTDGQLTVELLRALGRAELALGETGGIRTLATAFDASGDCAVRRQIALEVAQVARPARENLTAIRVLNEALADAEPGTPASERIESELISHQVMEPSTIEHAVRRIAAFVPISERLREPALLAVIALSLAVAARERDAAIDCAVRAMNGIDPEAPNPSAISPAAQALSTCDELRAADEALTLLVNHAVSVGSAPLFAFASCYRAKCRYAIGTLLEAESDARAAIGIFDEHGIRRPEARAFLLDILVDRGDLPAAAEEADRLAAARADMQLWDRTWSALATARLWIAQGRLGEALGELKTAGARMERLVGVRNPMSVPWRIEAGLVIARLGDPKGGLDLLEPALTRATRFGAARGIGMALRAKGLILGGTTGIELLEQAASALARSPSQLEHARAMVDLGASLRRQGRRSDAQAHLREALDMATRCGAESLAEPARAELAAAGARPRRDALRGRDALTASELRVARMAAQAMTNREIAQALFLTQRTVETHLTHAYQKLDIGSRGQLTQALQLQDASTD